MLIQSAAERTPRFGKLINNNRGVIFAATCICVNIRHIFKKKGHMERQADINTVFIRNGLYILYFGGFFGLQYHKKAKLQ
jgi:hypothetical protein